MPECTSCTVLRFELATLKTDLGVKTEELLILRSAQKDCARMAAEITDLHTLAEEQRRHMSSVSAKHVDPDVGVYTWLQQQSDRQTLFLNELKVQKEQEVYALRSAHVYEMAQLQQQIQTLTMHNQALLDQNRQSLELLTSHTERLQLLDSTIHEQRRQLAAVAEVDVDVGLLPLVKKGYLESNENVQAHIARGVENETQSLRAGLEAVREELDTHKEAASTLRAALEDMTNQHEYASTLLAQTRELEATAAADNLVLVDQVRRSNDFVQEWKRKYEEKCVEAEAFGLALTAHQEMQEYAQQLADLVSEKEEWVVEKEKLTKLSTAYLASIRHWQGEAKRITDELVIALSSRDAYQLRLYTVAAEKQALEDEKERLTGIMESQKKACAFVADVGQLWAAYCGMECPKPVHALDEAEMVETDEKCLAVVTDAFEVGSGTRTKKGKKNRNKK